MSKTTSSTAFPDLPRPGPSLPGLSRLGLSRRNLLQAGGVVLLLGRQHIAQGATIVAVRVWPAPDYSRVTLESDIPLTAKPVFVPSPPRLAVDVEGLDLNPALKELVAKVRADDPNIASIRVGQFAPGVVRLVIDLKQEARPQVFTLAPIAPYKHRLVLDLYPAKAVDPLEALISDRLRDARSTGAGAAPVPPPVSTPAPAVIAAVLTAAATSATGMYSYGARLSVSLLTAVMAARTTITPGPGALASGNDLLSSRLSAWS